MTKVAAFVCSCGEEISKNVDVDAVVEHIKKMPSVIAVKHDSLCLPSGKEVIQETLAREDAERVVIAGCSPKLNEILFKRVLKDSKLNPYLLEMANIREQCAWVHPDKKNATDKAKALVSAAIEKAMKLEPIESANFTMNNSVLIIGAGVAGIQAAVDLADQGFKVYLVDRNPTIGGNTNRLYMAFPTDDCIFCVASSKILPGIRKCLYRSSLTLHPNIEVLTYSEIKKLEGSVGNFRATIEKKPKFVDEKLCIACGRCSEVCPIEVANEFNFGMNKRKAIYIPFSNAMPFTYIIDEKNCKFEACGKCRNICPTRAINFDQTTTELELKTGAVIVAIGFEEYVPDKISEYGFGIYKNVVTQSYLARMLDPTGPTHGKTVRLSDGEKAKRILMIQCVGSRDKKTNWYCSGICCMFALKHAILMKEKNPDTDIIISYMDIRTPGDYESYYNKARELGVTFLRGRPAEIAEDPQTKQVIAKIEDTVSGGTAEYPVDLVVLSSALVPSKGTEDLAKILKIEVNGETGFVKQLYPKLKTVDTRIKGIYVCGAATGPKDVPQSVTEGSAAASRTASILTQGMSRDLAIAVVDENACIGCEICEKVCPHLAIRMIAKDERKIAQVSALECNGCGVCSANCLIGAIQLKHSGLEQLFSYLSGLLTEVKKNGLRPIIICFACDECGYAAIDVAGINKLQYPANAFVVRVPCLGRISALEIFKALEGGADGVLLAGCMPDRCHYVRGNQWSQVHLEITKAILRAIGLNENKVNMCTLFSAEPTKFVDAINEIIKNLSSS